MTIIQDELQCAYYCQEEESVFSPLNLAPEGWLIDFVKHHPDQSIKLHCLKIFQTNQSKLLAIAWLLPAENSYLSKNLGIASKRLTQSIFLQGLWVSPEANGLMPAALYLILRRGRIWNRKQIVILLDKNQMNMMAAIRMEAVDNSNTLPMAERKYSLYAQQLQYALHLCYQHCQGEFLQFVKQEFATEIIQTVTRFLQQFFVNRWSQAILQGSMTKQQYIQCLYNLHSYVRYTTRLCARCIALSDNPDLRNHYIEHLKGEINHERIIERDLKHLGADVDYLMKYYVTNSATKEFMMTQESTIAFYQDPVLMLACPLAAEGITAAITSDFIDALRQLISSWGVDRPDEAMRFILSHTNTDGGEDGHWENVKKMTNRFIQSEHQLQQFLSIYNSATEGLQRSFESCIEENYLWSNSPV